MSYRLTLEKAGATVLTFASFGSYQGDWWAKVIFNGQPGWVKGSYGSCSVCDAFQSAFDTDKEPIEKDGKYYRNWYYTDEGDEITKEEYDGLRKEYDQELADFGRGYLFNLINQEEAEKKASEDLEWDMGAEEMFKFIKENSF